MIWWRRSRSVSDYQLARIVEDMDGIRRNPRNTTIQRCEADTLMFLAEGVLRDRHEGKWPAVLA